MRGTAVRAGAPALSCLPRRSQQLRRIHRASASTREGEHASTRFELLSQAPRTIASQRSGDFEEDVALASSSHGSAEAQQTGQAGWWRSLEARYRVVVGCAASMTICNMDKVNISICIIPMALDFGWSPSVSGLVQSSFFYGYMLSQLPGGILASKYGGRRVLPAGLGLCSLATAGVPFLAATIPGLCVSRAAVGLGEAVAPSAAIDVVARIIPANERSRAVSFIFSGLHIGSIIGLLAAPPLISHFGWESVFFGFGAAGLVWMAWFEGVLGDVQRDSPAVAAMLEGRSGADAAAPAEAEAEAGTSGGDSHGGVIDADMPIPWRAFLRTPAVRALMYTHFCNNWFHYTMLAWLPTYFTDTLSVDLMHAAQTALLPPLAGLAASAAAGPAADALISAGVALPTVRKLAQCTAFVVPSAFLLWACTPAVMASTNLTVASITLALGISSFSLAGLYCTHQDLSPKYASAMLGLTNTAGALPGILGVATVGVLYDATQSWELALFVPSAFFMLTGAAVYTLLCRNAPVDFDAADNSPFPWEPRLRLPWGSAPAPGKDE